MMDRPQTQPKMTMTEKGWEVTEVPLDPTVAQPQLTEYLPPPVAEITLAAAQDVLKAHGFVAVLLTDIEELPKTHREKLLRSADRAPEAIDDAVLVEKVIAAVTMEGLDEIMDGVTSPVVIAAAEEKAIELTEGR